MLRPRKGRQFINQNGNAVSVRPHPWSPPTGNGEPTTSGSVRPQHTAALTSLGDDVTTPEPPMHRAHYRFSLGEPVVMKAAWQDTEIGRVDFTEDLVIGFNDRPPPLNEQEAWELIKEAADRYARLTAFIAAEQQETIEETNNKKGFGGKHDHQTPHPVRVLEALRRRRGEGEDPELDRVVAALDGSGVEDADVLIRAAEGYNHYLFDASLNRDRQIISEYNLDYARGIITGEFFRRDTAMLIDPPQVKFHYDGAHPADKILSLLPPNILASIEDTADLSPSTPFMERHKGGVRFNLSNERAIEIVFEQELDTRYKKGDKLIERGVIRRINTVNGEKVVVAADGWSSRRGGEQFLIATDFTRPLPIGWKPNARVGFAGRFIGREDA
jgi:hypothetical protein